MSLDKFISKYFKRFKTQRFYVGIKFLHELWPFIIVLAFATVEIGHIADSGWKHYFLYDGDSLTLPLLRQSIVYHEPFKWIFSSQIFLFPEALIYLVCGAITTSVRASLALNAYINISLLYVLFRLVAWAVPVQTKVRQRYYALVSSLLVILFMLLEKQPSINLSSIATLFIFTTYYYGVIISGLFVTLLSLLIISPVRRLVPSKRLVIFGLIFIVSVLTQLSNPLYSLQFVLPYALTVVILFVISQLSFVETSQFIGLQFISVILGQLLRTPLKSFIAAGLNGYIHPRQIPQSLNTFHFVFDQIVTNGTSLVEYSIILIVILSSFCLSLVYIRRISSGSKNLPPRQYVWLCIFACLEPVVLIISIISTGTSLTRYLVPVTIFPLLGILPLFSIKLPYKLSFYLSKAAIVGTIIIFILGVFSINKANKILNGSDLLNVQCLSIALDNKPAYGVGSFWTARSLEVYNTHSEYVLDVTPDLKVDAWLVNLGAYGNHQFSFVLTEQPPAPYSVPSKLINTLAPPAGVAHCSGFDVYLYKPGSASYKALNARIDDSLRVLYAQRYK